MGNQAGLLKMAESPGAGMVRDFFVYPTSVTFTALNQRTQITINVDADAPFVLVKMMYAAPGTPGALGGCLISIRDSGSGRTIFKNQTPVISIMGTGSLPFILPWVHVFPRNGTIELDVTNTGAATDTIYFTLAGYKIIPEANL